jgi:hypothetical protein
MTIVRLSDSENASRESTRDGQVAARSGLCPSGLVMPSASNTETTLGMNRSSASQIPVPVLYRCHFTLPRGVRGWRRSRPKAQQSKSAAKSQTMLCIDRTSISLREISRSLSDSSGLIALHHSRVTSRDDSVIHPIPPTPHRNARRLRATTPRRIV